MDIIIQRNELVNKMQMWVTLSFLSKSKITLGKSQLCFVYLKVEDLAPYCK